VPVLERKQTVLKLLEQLRGLDALKELFWTELNYERENKPLSMRGWPDSTRNALADDPILFASGGEDQAFHVLYCRLASDSLQKNLERPIVNQLIREHPYCLFVFSDKSQSSWHFLNVKYDDKAERRRLFRRITVRPDGGLRTAAERLQMLDLASLGKELFGIPALEIQKRHDDAFDVESVTKAFYKELANWYFWALKHVRFPKDAPKEADGHDHIGVIRMITRLIFCWFVKEKGLIPETLFDQRRLDKLLNGFTPDNNAGNDSVFYKAILQNLFFATLNTEMDKRGWVRDEQNFMAHSLYRYRDLFKKSDEALALFKNIPFLNGGLFECLDKDLGENARARYVRIDGFSRRPDSQPVVPDFLFFGPEREEDLSADYGDKKFRKVRVRGLIHTLHRYRFTIEENTPIEQEVALDPELSGKVFENLLAAYNPETGATARKQTGSFYTPREIVDYMVDEALIAFLKGRFSTENAEATEEKLRRLASWEESGDDFDNQETETLITAIDGLKALDPAVGSGAFPMGILHKLVFILGKLDPRNEQWKQRQIRRVRDAIDMAEKIEDAAIRERTVRELEQQIVGIEEAFERNELDYGRKLYLIENCLYGVDIQSIAVQIAKMRFFISLIVDQRIDPNAPNLGVRPLPNLETKFVAANTLIGIEKPDQAMFRNPDIDAKEAELRKVREKHFNAKTPGNKAKYREMDKKLRTEVAGLLKRDGWGDTTAKQLAAWDPYDQNASAPFFDPEWMFGVREGFDVVIGNPPYIRIQTLNQTDKTHAAWLKEHYASAAKGNYDLYVVFVERGLQLLEPHGQLAYILPHKFFNVQYGKPLRELIAEGKYLRHVVHFGDQQIFPGTTNYVCLLFLAKGGAGDCRWVRADDLPTWLQTQQGKEDNIPAKILTATEWNFAGQMADRLLEKLRCVGIRLLDIPAEMSRGSSTGDDEVFVIEKDSQHVEPEILRIPVYATDFSKYHFAPNSRWRVIFPYRRTSNRIELIPEKELQQNYPKAYKHLFSNKHRLSLRKGARHWYGYSAPRNLNLHDQAQILVPLLSESGNFATLSPTLLGKLCPMASGGFTISIPKTVPISPKYVLALLNSPVLFWILLRTSNIFRGGWITCTKQYFGELPIRLLNLSDVTERAQHDAIVGLVDNILSAKAMNPAADTSVLEREIDRMVYELYGLTEEEIAIVEGTST
jgi:type I restriction-modification system DNA methylase subunit